VISLHTKHGDEEDTDTAGKLGASRQAGEQPGKAVVTPS
jgi:hypothetical protein